MVELTDNIPWNNQYSYTSSEDVTNCAEILKNAETLKKKVSTGTENSDFKDIGEKLADRLSLQNLYRKLLISNLEYALDKKIEQDLWNVVFKNYITTLQQKAKDKSNVKRSDVQSQLSVFLEAASGFYAQLLLDLCQIFHLIVPCRIPISPFTLSNGQSDHSVVTQPERPSCQYMCQHCLVHLGDIARYRNQSGQAESYYRHAAQLVPSNGQPYNQLAILATASGDILSMAFYYCRSLAVKCPFLASSTNLKRQLSKIIDSDEPRHAKISISELLKYFLKFHACIYLKKNDEKLEKMSEKLTSYLQLHLRAGSLNQQHLIHITFLNLFSLCHRTLPLSSSPVSEKQINDQPKNSFALERTTLSWKVLLGFTMQLLDLFLACIPVYSEVKDDLDHIAMPAVKLTLDWLTTSPNTIELDEMTSYPRLWNNFAALLNALKLHNDIEAVENLPLPEDLEIRGFIGLKESLSKWNFSKGCDSIVDIAFQHEYRCHRLLNLGYELSKRNPDLLTWKEDEDGVVFSSPLEYTNTSPITVEDVVLAEEELDSPTAGSSSRLRPTEIKIERNKDRRKQTNASQLKADKLNAIKEEENSNDIGKKSSDGSHPSESTSTSKSSHHVTFAQKPIIHGSASPSPNYLNLSPPAESRPLPPNSDYHIPDQNMSFQRFRTDLKSPVLTPEEHEYSVGFQQYVPSNGSQPIQMPVNQYSTASFMNSANLQRYNMLRNQQLQQQQQAPNMQDLSQFVQMQSPVNPVQPMPMHMPTQNENIKRGLPQFPQQRNAMYNTMDPLRNLVQKPVKMEHIPPPPQQQRMTGFLAPTFTGLQPPQRGNVPNPNHFMMQNQAQNPASFQTSGLQPRNLPPTENQNYPPDLSADVQNILNNPKAITTMLQSHKDDFNAHYLGYSSLGRSPEGSNNTSSTSSPTPGLKIASKSSPHAGSRAIGRPPFPGIESLAPDFQPLLQSISDQQNARYLQNETSGVAINDKEFGSKPCRDDNPSDLFAISPGSLPSFMKPDSYKLFPDTDSTWSIGQGNNRNGNKLGSIGSERAIAHQQFSSGPMSQFSPWSENYPAYRSTEQEQGGSSGMNAGDSSFERPTDSFWSMQPSSLEQLLRQQQESDRHHNPPP